MKKWTWILFGFLLFAVLTPSALFADESEVLAKLKTISDKQDTILAQLEAIKAELNIVKVRTSLNG